MRHVLSLSLDPTSLQSFRRSLPQSTRPKKTLALAAHECGSTSPHLFLAGNPFVSLRSSGFCREPTPRFGVAFKRHPIKQVNQNRRGEFTIGFPGVHQNVYWLLLIGRGPSTPSPLKEVWRRLLPHLEPFRSSFLLLAPELEAGTWRAFEKVMPSPHKGQHWVPQ